ncbi:MAG: hypothetical protein ACOYVK_15095 [Bacillota bacterium]
MAKNNKKANGKDRDEATIMETANDFDVTDNMKKKNKKGKK